MHSTTLLKLSRLAKQRSTRPVNQKGFTLVELLIVVVIIGILSAVGIPAYLSQATTAKRNAAKSGATNIARACAAALVTGDSYTPSSVTGGAGTCATSETLTFTANGYTGSVAISSDGTVGAATVSP